jgi:hypothetical protein
LLAEKEQKSLHEKFCEFFETEKFGTCTSRDMRAKMVNPGDYIYIRMIGYVSFNHLQMKLINDTLMDRLEDIFLFELEDKMVVLYGQS